MKKYPELDILAESPDAGIYLVSTHDGKQVFATGHSEYDPLTLKGEYDRDVNLGLPIAVPCNYYPNDDPAQHTDCALARSRQPVVLQLVELLRLRRNAVQPG